MAKYRYISKTLGRYISLSLLYTHQCYQFHHRAFKLYSDNSVVTVVRLTAIGVYTFKFKNVELNTFRYPWMQICVQSMQATLLGAHKFMFLLSKVPSKVSLRSGSGLKMQFQTRGSQPGVHVPSVFICLTKDVHLRLAVKEKNIITYLFPNIYTCVSDNIFKNPYMLIVEYICD